MGVKIPHPPKIGGFNSSIAKDPDFTAFDLHFVKSPGLYTLAGGLRDGKLILNTNDGYDFFDPEQLALAKIQRGDYVIAPNGQTG
jgi:hypothetical protein